MLGNEYERTLLLVSTFSTSLLRDIYEMLCFRRHHLSRMQVWQQDVLLAMNLQFSDLFVKISIIVVSQLCLA